MPERSEVSAIQHTVHDAFDIVSGLEGRKLFDRTTQGVFNRLDAMYTRIVELPNEHGVRTSISSEFNDVLLKRCNNNAGGSNKKTALLSGIGPDNKGAGTLIQDHISLSVFAWRNNAVDYRGLAQAVRGFAIVPDKKVALPHFVALLFGDVTWLEEEVGRGELAAYRTPLYTPGDEQYFYIAQTILPSDLPDGFNLRAFLNSIKAGNSGRGVAANSNILDPEQRRTFEIALGSDGDGGFMRQLAQKVDPSEDSVDDIEVRAAIGAEFEDFVLTHFVEPQSSR